VAKKARQRLEEPEEASFEFPTFDEPKFIHHELEQTFATLTAFGLSIAIGVVSFLVGRAVDLFVVPFVVGLALVAASPWVVQRLRTESSTYTRGEWAGLIAIAFFGWLGIWFLLSDLIR